MSEESKEVNVNVRGSEKLIDPLVNTPAWLRVAASFSAVGIVFTLFCWLIFKIVNGQDDALKQYESLITRFDKSLEAHDVRMRDWMKSVQDRNALEHEKNRMEIKSLSDQLRLLKDAIILRKEM